MKIRIALMASTAAIVLTAAGAKAAIGQTPPATASAPAYTQLAQNNDVVTSQADMEASYAQIIALSTRLHPMEHVVPAVRKR